MRLVLSLLASLVTLTVLALSPAAPMVRGGLAGSPLPPNEGQLVWLSADTGCFSDAGVTPCVNTDTVRQQNDRSGNANNFTQSTAGSRPSYITSVLGGKPGLRFSGTKLLVGPSVTPTNGEYTKLLLMRPSAVNAANNVFDGTAGHALYFNGGANPIIFQGHNDLTSSVALGTSNFVLLQAGVSTHTNNEAATETVFHLSVNNAMAGIGGYPNQADANTSDATLYLGGAGGAGAFNGDIAEAFLYSRLLGAWELNNIATWANAKYGTAIPAYTKMAVFHGDSITVGYKGTITTGYPAVTCAAISGLYCADPSVGATQLNEMNAEAVSYIDRLAGPGFKNVIVLFAGTNDFAIAGTSAATLYSQFQTYCAARHQAGFKVVAVTMLPRAGSNPVNNTTRGTYNTSLRNDTCRDAVADIAGDSNIGCDSCAANTTYYDADATHPNTTGHAVIATYVEAAINAL